MKRKWGVFAVIIALGGIILRYVIAPTVVFGESMLPTLQPWDVCWMRWVDRYEPVRGDVVMFRTADAPPLRFVKRVIAVPGETLEIRAGVVFINQQPLPEPYTTINPAWSLPATNVPPGKVYVIGDYRDFQQEWAVQGFVATRLIQGRMVAHWRWR